MSFTPPGPSIVRNRLGIVEFGGAARKAAAAMQIIFVPLVGFDGRGNRLGMGAGFTIVRWPFDCGVDAGEDRC